MKQDPKHYGCIYNVACSFYFEAKYENALKWFDFSIKVVKDDKGNNGDSYFGKTVTYMKLGQFEKAKETIDFFIKQKINIKEVKDKLYDVPG